VIRILNEEHMAGDYSIERSGSLGRERKMTEEKATAACQEESSRDGEKKRYQKPIIAEEESYETCAILACALKSGRSCAAHYTNS
jgi:hypothetical protein